MIRNHLLLLAQYNHWATDRLNQQLKDIPADDFHRDAGLFFKSIAGTLNHLLLGEHYIWYSRFKAGTSLALALDTVIHTEQQALLNELQQKSVHWISLLDQLDPTTLDGQLTYTAVTGKQLTLPYAATLIHVFNHGTHHRGQVTAALTMMGYPCPELDLVRMLAEQSKG
ncbi:DinB family protein [Acinetobacter sp. WZC-1]|uniref:DinB family protein n=1 Tax=Acinetobacter sp. WZC-1 TaxID=3459034 RepID=UPI00403D7535